MDPIAEYCREAIMDDDGNELVVESCACPRCGERRMDWLVWTEGDTVRCETCGHIYTTEEN